MISGMLYVGPVAFWLAGTSRPMALTKPDCHCVFKAKWIADGDSQLSDLNRSRVRQSNRLKLKSTWIHFDDCQITIRICAYQTGIDSRSIGKSDGDTGGAIYHVVIGYNVALGIPNKTRS